MADNFYSSYPVTGGSGVTTLNSLSGALTLAAGTGISITDNGSNTITITATGSGTDVTLAPFGSSPNANGASLAVQVLTLQPANATNPGGVSTTTQSFAGNKTFTGTIAASNFSGSSSGTNTGDITLTAVGSSPNANGASLSGQALTLQPATTSFPGVLLAADWNTFNNKQPAGNYITALTGDVTASGPGSVAATLATVNGNVGSFTLSNITVNAKGLITAASSTATGNLTDAGTDGIVITGGTGAVIGSGTSIAQHVADSTHNGYLSSTDWSTFNGKQNTVTIGTFNSQASQAKGLAFISDVLYAQAPTATNPGMVSIPASASALSLSTAALSVAVDGSTVKINGSNQLEALQPNEERITLSGTDITNQYVDLAHVIYGTSASSNSATLFVVGGPMQLKTVDYTVSLTGGSGGVTRISFAGDLATGGGAALIAGDILVIDYMYLA